MSKRIMFVGPSGIGKTTLAKYVAKREDLPFISGSILPCNMDFLINFRILAGLFPFYRYAVDRGERL